MPLGVAVVGDHGSESGGVGWERESSVSDGRGFITVDWLTPRRGTIPALVHVTGQLGPAHQHVSRVTRVPYHWLELTSAIDEDQLTIRNICWHPTLKIWNENIDKSWMIQLCLTYICRQEETLSRIQLEDKFSWLDPPTSVPHHRHTRCWSWHWSLRRWGWSWEAALACHMLLVLNLVN